MKIEDLSKNTLYSHDSYGTVEFLRKEKENSKKMVVVKCVERGRGWDETYKKYTGIKTKCGWYLGKNRYYNQEFIVNIKNLNPCYK